MTRYFFHLLSGDEFYPDCTGVPLQELSEAHAYAMKLQHQIRQYAREQKFSLIVKVVSENGATPLVILPPQNPTG